MSNPEILVESKAQKKCVKFVFRGKLTETDAMVAVKKWEKIFHQNMTDRFVLIWHCLEMTGYEPLARSVWQKAIKSLKKQIDCIWLISDSKIIQAGANIMSVFTSFKIHSVSAEDKINLQ